MRNPVVRFHIEGPNTYGDLELTGFATSARLGELAMEIADVLRRRYGAVVTTTIEPQAPAVNESRRALQEAVDRRGN